MDRQMMGCNENIAAGTSATTTMMMLKRRVIDGCKRAFVWDMVKVLYNVNDL